MDKKIYGLVLVAMLALATLLFFLLSAYFFMENTSLKKEVASLKDEVEKSNGENVLLNATLADKEVEIKNNIIDINNLTLQLNQTQVNLSSTALRLEQAEGELNNTQIKLNETATSLAQTKEETTSLQNNLTAMYETLNESIQWFQSNSVFPDSVSDPVSSFPRSIRTNCIASNILNLGCIQLFMEKKLNFNYLNETTAKLHTIDELVAQGGGNCVDYSLFMKALLNSLANETTDLQLLSWQPGADRFKVYESSGGSYWYYHGSGLSLGGLDGVHPYVVCYAISQEPGHCIIALSKNSINSVADMSNLDQADTFDPQDGLYMGTVEVENVLLGGLYTGPVSAGNGLRLCSNGDAFCGSSTGDIFVVMTNDDVYQFINGQWESPGTYRDEVQAMQLRLTGDNGS